MRLRETELPTEILTAAEVRGSLTLAGDIRSDVAFQNDVNALLARVEQFQMPWRSLSDLNPAPLESPIVVDTTPLPVAVPASARGQARGGLKIPTLTGVPVAGRQRTVAGGRSGRRS
jgi:hypothetical protein